MNLNLKKTIAFTTVVILFTSCASILSKSKWPVSFETEPAKASVIVTDKKENIVYEGTTPSAIKLKSGAGFFGKASYTVKFHLDGYEDKLVPLSCNINGWYFGNIAIGGLVGLIIVDPATGAMWKLDKDQIYEKLQPANAKKSSDVSLHILDIKNIPEEMRSHLEKIK